MIAHELAEKIGGEVTEFFLPRDFDEPCLGCWTCFNKDLTHCPHYKKLKPLMDAMDEADVVILASPVYVYHATGQMMAFLDHFGTRWMVHRPDARAFQKQGVAIATAAGGGMASTTKDLYHSMFFWGYLLSTGYWNEEENSVVMTTELKISTTFLQNSWIKMFCRIIP